MYRTFLELFVTKTCNLNCLYCYERNYHLELSDPKAYMSLDEMVKRIELYRSKVSGPISVELFGGEPLLNLKNIKSLLEYYENDSQIFFGIITNCTIFDNLIVKNINSGKLNMECSIDPPITHKNKRIFRYSNNNSFTHVLSIYKKYIANIDRKKIPRIRATYTGDNFYDLLYWSLYHNKYGLNGIQNNIFINIADNKLDPNLPHHFNLFADDLLVVIFSYLAFIQKLDLNYTICPFHCVFCTRRCQNSGIYHLTANAYIPPLLVRYNSGYFENESEPISKISLLNTGQYFNKKQNVYDDFEDLVVNHPEELYSMIQSDYTIVDKLISYFNTLLDNNRFAQAMNLSAVFLNINDIKQWYIYKLGKRIFDLGKSLYDDLDIESLIHNSKDIINKQIKEVK